jgi:hypothetical protein
MRREDTTRTCKAYAPASKAGLLPVTDLHPVKIKNPANFLAGRNIFLKKILNTLLPAKLN